MDLESMAAGGGVVGGLGVIITGLVKLVGSRKERSADTQAAADEWQQLHHECRKEVAELRAEMCESQMTMRASITALEERQRQEHAPCRAVEAAQQEQIDQLRAIDGLLRAIDGLLRAIDGLLTETSRHGSHPDELQRELTRLEEKP